MSAASENTLTIKVRSQDPVGEYEFSVCKTVRFLLGSSLSLSLSSRERLRLFPKAARRRNASREKERDFHFFIDRNKNARGSSEIETRFHEEDAV